MSTPRERTQRALKHQIPDRTPLDLGSTSNTTITKGAYDNLRKFLGLEPDPDPHIISVQFQAVSPKEDLLKKLHIDTRSVLGHPPEKNSPHYRSRDEFVDEWGIIYKASRVEDKLLYFSPSFHPLKKADTLEEIENYDWPDPTDPGRTKGLREKAKHLYGKTDYALVGHMGDSSIFEVCWGLRSMERFFTDLLNNKPLAEALLQIVMEIQKEKLERFLVAVGDFIDVVSIGDDIASQSSLMISPKLYRKMIKPFQQQYFATVKQKAPNTKLMLHSCGSIKPVLNDFIEMGVDAINPVQVSAKEMEPDKLKEEFGDKITFWGGVDTQKLLSRGRPDEVRSEVQRLIRILGDKGGYVFGAVHNIQNDVTPENIVAMYETAFEMAHS